MCTLNSVENSLCNRSSCQEVNEKQSTCSQDISWSHFVSDSYEINCHICFLYHHNLEEAMANILESENQI